MPCRRALVHIENDDGRLTPIIIGHEKGEAAGECDLAFRV